jgi:ketosteroid isomerase-like protein
VSDDAAEAQAAVDALIDAYANHRRDEYFSWFAPDATFIFHTSPMRLESRSEYEEFWLSWETQEQFHVIDCTSTNRRMQVFGDTAVFTHDVNTTLSMNGEVEHPAERETIVMRRSADVWACVHEHLSGRD